MTLLKQRVECRLRGQCDGLNSSQIKTNINALKVGCEVCPYMFAELEEIEKNYEFEMIFEDFKNYTYIDYLKDFFDLSLIHQQSFCMSGQKEVRLVESLAFWGGFCYTIGQGQIFEQKT